MQCGAKTRSGAPCRSKAMPNGRCRMHGGKSLSGAAVNTFKHGRYSKHLPTRLAARYQEALADQEILSLHEDIALLDLRIWELLGSGKKTPNAVEWFAVEQALDLRRRLVDSERKRLVDMQQLMTTEQAMTLLAAVVDTVRKHVHDRHALAAISQDISRLVAG